MTARAVWKFPLQVTDAQVIVAPMGAAPLAVQMQGDTPCLWALVEPGNPPENRTVQIVGTGHVRDGLYRDDFCGTFQLEGGALIFHVFMGLPA